MSRQFAAFYGLLVAAGAFVLFGHAARLAGALAQHSGGHRACGVRGHVGWRAGGVGSGAAEPHTGGAPGRTDAGRRGGRRRGRAGLVATGGSADDDGRCRAGRAGAGTSTAPLERAARRDAAASAGATRRPPARAQARARRGHGRTATDGRWAEAALRRRRRAWSGASRPWPASPSPAILVAGTLLGHRRGRVGGQPLRDRLRPAAAAQDRPCRPPPLRGRVQPLPASPRPVLGGGLLPARLRSPGVGRGSWRRCAWRRSAWWPSSA